MATRRPKVPRATPAAPTSPDKGDGGAVIRADFGGHRTGGTGTGTGAGAVPGPAAAAAGSAAGRPTPDRPPAQAAAPAPGRKAPGTPGPAATAQSPSPSQDHSQSQDPVPAKAFSGRMLALAVVMVAITVMLAPTVKIFVDKRAEIAALQADIGVKQAQQADLKRQVSRWQDPDYVKQQARDRINMVMPGETGYWVFGGDLPAGASGGTAGEGPAQARADLPWVDALWESIRRSATD